MRSTLSAQLPGNPITVGTGIHWPRRGPRATARGPRPESVDEVAKWEDPDGFGKIELFYAPLAMIFSEINCVVASASSALPGSGGCRR